MIIKVDFLQDNKVDIKELTPEELVQIKYGVEGFDESMDKWKCYWPKIDGGQYEYSIADTTGGDYFEAYLVEVGVVIEGKIRDWVSNRVLMKNRNESLDDILDIK